MRTKRQRIGRVLGVALFLLLGLLLFGRISDIFRLKADGESDAVRSFYHLEEDSIDVLCLGSSHAYCSFCPNTLWEEQGITSYALSTSQQTAAMSYWLLRAALQRQKPKVAVLETYYLFFDRKYTTTPWVRQAFDAVPMGTLKAEILDDLLGEQDFGTRLSYYIPFIKYHSRWQELESSDFQTAPYLKGQYLSLRRMKTNGHGDPEERTEMPEASLTYLEKIIDLCEENQIELVLYSAPFGYGKKAKDLYWEQQGINLYLEEYAAGRGIPFLYLQKEDALEVDYAEDFCNAMHLNTYGSWKVSSYLGEYLAEKYDLEDHRGDPAYASWEADYQKYMAYVGEKEAQEKEG